MSLIYLLLAGLFESIWVALLRYLSEERSLSIIIVCGLSLLLSIYFLYKATQMISLTVAYSAWVGFGLLGSLVIETAFYQQPLLTRQILGCLLFVVAVALLKPHH